MTSTLVHTLTQSTDHFMCIHILTHIMSHASMLIVHPCPLIHWRIACIMLIHTLTCSVHLPSMPVHTLTHRVHLHSLCIHTHFFLPISYPFYILLPMPNILHVNVTWLLHSSSLPVLLGHKRWPLILQNSIIHAPYIPNTNHGLSYKALKASIPTGAALSAVHYPAAMLEWLVMPLLTSGKKKVWLPS